MRKLTKKNNDNLSPSEKKILLYLESGETRPVPNENKEISKLVSMARKQAKDKRINLRINESILNYFEMEAKRFGVPYQSLIGSVLFRYINGEIVDVQEVKKVLRVIK